MNKKTISYPMIRTLSALALSGIMLAACASSPSITTATPSLAPTTTPTLVSPPSITANPEVLAALEGSLEDIYTQVDPSVVHIRVIQEVNLQTQFQSPFFPFSTPQAPQRQEGTGSGFVWDNQGHIITNNHVIQDAIEIQVTFQDGISVPAQVVGSDPDSDLAVIKVDRPSEALHPVTMDQKRDVKVGQLAIAIGNPFGLQGSMTLGVVSAVGRSLPVENNSTQSGYYTIPAVIQTDAPINPGSSGGVLVNDQGQVIGVTSALISPVDASAGIGFAIPAVIVEKVIPDLIATGQYLHPYIGISGTTLTSDIAKAMQLPGDQSGVLVIDATPSGPADLAGVKGSERTATIDDQEVPVGGDVITAIDDQPVKSFDDLAAYLALETEVDQTVQLSILRNGKPLTLQLTLKVRPTENQQLAQETSQPGAYLGILGISVTPEIAQAVGLSSVQQGVLIERVEQNSPADQAGLRGSYKAVQMNGQEILIGGDVITSINNIAMTTIDDLQALLKQMRPDQQAYLSIIRDGRTIEVTVTLGQTPS
jgi:serine protease Do